MHKKCEKCNRQYSELEKFCSKCTLPLVNDDNRCSELRTAYCRNKIFKEDDVVCSYCGSPTTYALDKKVKTTF